MSSGRIASAARSTTRADAPHTDRSNEIAPIARSRSRGAEHRRRRKPAPHEPRYPTARELAGQLDVRFAQDAALIDRLNRAQQRLQSANDRLWSELHPDGLATVYGEDLAGVDVAFAEHRSEVLGALDPLAAIQRVHWSIHTAFLAYQATAKERRNKPADALIAFLEAL